MFQADLLDCTDARGFASGQQINLYDGKGKLLVASIPLVGVQSNAQDGTPYSASLRIEDRFLRDAGISDFSQVPVPFYVVADSVLVRFSDATPVPNTGERLKMQGSWPFWVYDEPTADDARVRDIPLPPVATPWELVATEQLGEGTLISVDALPQPQPFSHYGPFLTGTLPPLPLGVRLCLYGGGESLVSAQTTDRQPLLVEEPVATDPPSYSGGCVRNLPDRVLSAPLGVNFLTSGGWGLIDSLLFVEETDSGNPVTVWRVTNTYAFDGKLPLQFAADQDYSAAYRQVQDSSGTTYEGNALTVTNLFFAKVFSSMQCRDYVMASDLSHDPPGTTLTVQPGGMWTLNFSPPLDANVKAGTILTLEPGTPDTTDHHCRLSVAPEFDAYGFDLFVPLTMKSM
jgi:hypothetical protein